MKVLHVFTIDSTPKSFFDGQFQFLSDEGNQDIHLVTASEKDEEFCQRNHLQYHQIDIARRIDIKADFRSICKLKNLIKRERFDIVVGHTPKGALVAMCAAFLSGVKRRVYYRHGLIYTTASGARRLLLKTIERFTGLLSTHIVNVSHSLSRLAVKDGLNSDKKQSVFGKGTCGGIDTQDLFNPELINAEELKKLRQELDLNDSFVVGFCGRVCKEKGIRELIDGFRLFASAHPELNPRLLLVGGFDTRDILSDEYKRVIETSPEIIHTGKIPKEKLPLYYSLMDVFVFPSYREGFGMSVIEAGAMNVPALVSRSHGCEDSIKENISGQYIDISTEGIKEGLEFISKPENRDKLSSQCRNHIVNHYDRSILWPQILNFYSNL